MGDTLYATLAEAANVATKGQTVTILRSTDETAVFAYGVVIEKAEGVVAPNATNEVAVDVPANVVGDIVNNSGVETETVNGVVGALQNNEAVISNTPTNLPDGAKLVVTLVNIIFESEAPAKVVYDVTPKNGDAEVEPTEEITFRLPVPANWKYAKVYHETALEGIYPVQEGNYVEVASQDFSEFAVEIAEPVAKIGDVDYYTFEAALDAAHPGDEVVVVANVADVVVDIDKNLTISGSATLDNVGLNANGADALTVKGLDFTGNSWINSGTAEALTVSGITANVAPVNTSYTNSRSAFISLGKVEAQQLALTVEDSKITVTSQGPDAILGWAAITEATIKNNVLKGSSDGYFNNADAVKFMAIADGAKFDIRGNEIYSNYNGIVFAQNTTRDNAYSVEAAGNKFVGGADHIWIEVSGGDVTHATFNAASDNTVNGNAITANDIKYHSAVIKSWSSYAGIDVVTDADGKVIGGTLASFSNEESLADGFVFNDNGDGTYGVQFASYIVLPEGVNSSNYAAKFGDNTVTDGTNYYATLQAAVEAVAGQANAVLYCKPGADVGSLQHAPVTSTLTVYGNGADVTGDTERDFDLGNTDPSVGTDITADMTLTVKHLNGCSVWGTKATEHTVNLVFENCANMGKVFINGTTGTLNITMTDCAFEGVIKEAVYSNADGAITLTNVAFSNLNKAVNLNHKAAGTQTVTIDGCTFTDCGADVAADQIPVRVLSSVEGGKSVLAVTGSTFTGTPEGGADILLDYGVGLTTASVSGTAANVVVEKENNVGTTTAVKADETVEFTTALPVAQVGETKYMTLAEAFANAQADDIVTLVNNVALENPVVISGKALTLDLGAYTIEDKSTAVLTKDDDVWALIDLENGANLTVRGTGTIKANYAEVQGGWTGMAYCINVDNTSKLTVDGGNFINGNGGVQTLGEVVVNGGTFVSHNGGTCILATYTDAKVTVNGGTFKDSVEESDLYTGSGAVWAGFGAKIEIKGGTFDFAADPENGNVVWTLFPAQNAIAGYGVNAEMAVSGGTFVNFNPAENVIVDYSPSTGFTFGSVVAEGYAALQNLDGNYVVGVEPTATVNNLGMTTVKAGDYSIWNGSFDQNTEDDGDMPLSFVMQFLADQDAEDMETSPFADWYGDFVITFTGIENGSFTADGCYLAGHYGSFGWVKVPVDGMTIEEDARYPVMLGVGMGQKYNYICSSVEDFKCALYLTPEILEANPNIQVKLELAVVDNSKGSDAAASALVNNDKVYSVTEYTYNADDFEKVELPEVVITDIKGSLTDSDPDLTFALNFAIKDVENLDPEYLEKLFAQYGDWYTDYVLTISGLTDEDVTFNANGDADGYLSGQYDAWSENWVSVPFEDVTLANNESIYIMEYAAKLMGQSGLRFTLAEVAEIVQNFDCGVYFTPEFLAANPGMKVDLQLKVFTEDAEGNKVNDINVATNNFDIEDYVAIVHATGKQTQYCTTFADAVDAAADGATITMLRDVVLTEAVKVVGKAITLDLNGKTVSGVCNSNQGHLVYIENGAGLTVKDGAVDGGGKLTYAQGTSNVGWTVDVEGNLTLESGTIELTGEWSIGYAVDVRPNAWGVAYTNPSVFTMNGGKLVSSDGAVRVASSSADNYANVSASFEMNGGEIDAAWDGVFIQQSNTAYDVLNFTINNGTIKGGLNPVRVYGPAPTSYVNGQECMSINFNGGTMTYTGTETREWVIDGVLRVGGGSSIETIVENGNITASEAFAQAQALPEGYIWEQDGETYKVVEAPATGKISYRAYINDSESREAVQVDLENVYARNSLVVKLFDAEGNALTTTTLKQGGVEAAAYTCNIVLWGTASGSWDTEIHAEKLTVANYPQKGELWIDGNLVDTFDGILGNVTDAAAYQLPAYLALDCVYKEAKVGETYYATLADAVAAAEGETVTMLADVELTESLVIDAGKEVVLDLNGKTVSMADASGKAAYAIKNNGNLTIVDNSDAKTGKITFNSTTPDNSFGYATSTIGNGGSLTVESGTIENTTVGGASYAIDGIWHTDEASLTINGGTIVANKIAVRQVPSSATANNVVTVNGGTLTGATAGLQLFNINNDAKLAEVNIHGGEFNGTYAFYTSFTSAAASEDVTINIDGGEFNGYLYLYNGNNGSDEYPMTVSVTGGTFNGGAYIYTKDANGDEVAIPSITGGIFANDVTVYCADGYLCEAIGDGIYGIVADPNYIAELVIDDAKGENYTNDTEKRVGTLTYKRTLINGKWNALYLPFEVELTDELLANYDFADYNQMISHDTNGDRVPDSFEMELFIYTSGTLDANYPYFVRPKNEEACSMNLVLTDAALYPANEISLVTSSVKNTFKLSGTYKAMGAEELAGKYAISIDGDWSYTSALKPYRLYFTITDNNSSVVTSVASKSVRIVVRGEDGYTGVEGVENENGEDMIFDLQGRRVLEPEKGGIYIKNGKKIIF